MLDITVELKTLVARLDEENIDYALCGGMAMAVHRLPRFTIDIDLLIQEQSLAAALKVADSLGYDIRGKDLSFAAGAVEIRRVAKVDMSPKAITTRLKRVEQLRRLGLSLKKVKIPPTESFDRKLTGARQSSVQRQK